LTNRARRLIKNGSIATKNASSRAHNTCEGRIDFFASKLVPACAGGCWIKPP
jgi:hypothetical protein